MYNSNVPNVNFPNLFIETQRISVTFSLVGLAHEFISNLTDHYLGTASGHTQWEPPASGSPPDTDLRQQEGGSPPPTHHHTKQRQYAAGQTQAYYGGDGLADPTSGHQPRVAAFHS